MGKWRLLWGASKEWRKGAPRPYAGGMRSFFAEIAERFGLSWDPSADGILSAARLQGEQNGQKVICSATDRGTRMEAPFEPALDLGLSVSTRQFTLTPTLGRKVALGDSSFDDEVHASADEPQRAAKLLSRGLCEVLLQLNAGNLEMTMTDERVSVLSAPYDMNAVATALPKIARVAELVAEARKRVPETEALSPYARELTAFGAERGLTVEKTPLSASGLLADAALGVRFLRVGQGTYELSVKARPVEVIAPMGLLIRRESLVDRVHTFFGGQDLRTGDPLFDPVFLVRATDAERATLALDADARAWLLDLAARFYSVTLSDAGLSLRGPVTRIKASDLPMALDATQSVVSRVARASSSVAHGPYR